MGKYLGMLETRSLTYHSDKRELLKKISLTFKPSVLYGILGPNGSGKTTLLKNLCGVWKPHSGEVYWQGENLLNKPRSEISKIISLVPQYVPLYFDLTVEDLVAMGRYSHGTYDTQKDKEMIEWALETVEVSGLRHSSLSQLSSGERQRVYIARALVTEAPVILFDEPTANLDIRHQLKIWQLLQTLRDQGKVVLVTSHELASVSRYCDQAVVMHQGSSSEIASYEQLVTPELLETVFGISHPT